MTLRLIIILCLLFYFSACNEYKKEVENEIYSYNIEVFNNSEEDVYLFLNNWIIVDSSKTKFDDRIYPKNYHYNPSLKVNKIMVVEQPNIDSLPKIQSSNFITSFIGQEPPLFLYLKSNKKYELKIDSLKQSIKSNSRVQLICFTKEQLDSLETNYIIYHTNSLVFTINNKTSIGVINIKQDEIKFDNLKTFNTLEPFVLYGKLKNVKSEVK